MSHILKNIRILFFLALLFSLPSVSWATLSVKSGTLSTPLSTGNQAITGVGFQPKLVMFYSTAGGDANYETYTIGAATSSSARWTSSTDALIPITNYARSTYYSSSKCFVNQYSADGIALTIYLSADFVSMDSDGFTINWGTVDGANHSDVHYIAFGGSDFSGAVGTVVSNSSTGNQSVTGVGFQPKAVLSSAVSLSTYDGIGYVLNNHMALGMATSSSSRFSASFSSDPFGTPSTSAVLNNTKWWTHINNSNGTVYGEADFVSNDSDGFTFNITTVTSASTFSVGWVALGGTAQYKVGTFAQPGSTGNQAVTGVGFAPSAEIFTSIGLVSSTSIANGNPGLLFGTGISSSDRRLATFGLVSGGSYRKTSTTQSIYILNYDGTSPSNADFVSQDSDGFTVNWAAADATARIVGYLAIGAAAGGGSSIKTVDGLAKASIKTVNGLAIASVKTINGLP